MPKQIGQAIKEKELPAPEEEKLLEEVGKPIEIGEGIKPYIQKVEEEPQIPDDLKQHLHSPAQAASQVIHQGPTINLPLTEEEINKGLQQTVWDSILWLATWCVKIAKEATRLGYQVIFGKK